MKASSRDTKSKNVFFLIIAMLLSFGAEATHLRAGQITAQRIGCSRTFRITVTVFTDTESGIRFGGDEDFLDFGDGTDPDGDGRPGVKVPETESTTIPGPVSNLGTASFTIDHEYTGNGTFIISYIEPNRNDHILNIDNSVNTRFYLESKIILDPFVDGTLGCNSTPILLIPPIDQGCTGVAFFHNPGAYDPDGDSLTYEFVIPYKARGTVVDNYRFPDASEFYSFLDYNNANEEANGPPDITIDPVSGTVVWDAPGAAGEYNIAFIVREWRKGPDGQWYQLGFVRRDMQIIISNCDNDRPELLVPQDTCVVAGTTLEAPVYAIDPNGDPVKIEAFSEILNLEDNKATYSPFPPIDQPSGSKIDFTWNTTCEHVKEQPYQVVFKVTDHPENGPRLVTFATWNIKVVAPAPVWDHADVDLARRYAHLEWEPYECAQGVQNIKLQIWRRVDDVSFTPANCEVGMPDYLGYQLIATVNGNETTFVDTNNGMGLAVGAGYCYRLVAQFPAPGRGESYVSDPICIDPINADAPVITNVSVQRTGDNDGEVLIKWRPPFQLDESQFPGDKFYVVQRAESLAGPFISGLVHGGQKSETDTTAIDGGLNTEDKIYYYRVLLFAPDVDPDVPIDTSAIASTVRLELKPQTGMIELNWGAFVPWSNQIQTFPLHLIFRGDEGSVINADLTKYDSVNVFSNGLLYSDNGKGTPLNNSTVYCYQVETRGGYGNDDLIPPPLKNLSQIICAQPRDSIPPCKPSLVVDATDCNDFINQSCDFSEFENTIRWQRVDDECANDVAYYRVYASAAKDGEFGLIADNVRDTFYIEKNLSSFARCYKISAVDRSGNESELSESACNENCPYYELPNLITPNGDHKNDTFSAISLRTATDPCNDEGQDCDEEIQAFNADLETRCARFVKSVKLTVVNRWGKEVYTYESGGENSIYIDWDGRDKNGKELPAAVYYYSAEVEFYAADPSKGMKLIKGWVQIMR